VFQDIRGFRGFTPIGQAPVSIARRHAPDRRRDEVAREVMEAAETSRA
jgi:hypothetical protein